MDWKAIRDQFPITKTILDGPTKNKKLIYMDHAASTHAPKPVIDAYMYLMENRYANVHRGEHELSCFSTEKFEEVPQKISRFLGVGDLDNNNDQIVLTSNTTSSLDLGSHLFAEQKGAVLTTLIEHHSNILPHKRRGETYIAQTLPSGILDLDDFQEKLQQNEIKLVAVSAGSNVTGYMPPIHKLARMAHDAGAKILVDAAQRLAHYPIDVKPKDHPEHIDFLAGGGHKFYAPMGASFLYGDKEIMDNAPPYVPGGGTVAFVSEDNTIFLEGPDRHQFGTPNIGGSIAMGTAVDFLYDIGMQNVRNHELQLLKNMLKGIQSIEGITVYGDIPIAEKIGVVSFNIEGMKHNELSHLLDHEAGIATRNGCFCAGPYMHKLLNITEEESLKLQQEILKDKNTEIPGAVRASIGIYNTEEEVDIFLDTVEDIATGKIRQNQVLKI